VTCPDLVKQTFCAERKCPRRGQTAIAGALTHLVEAPHVCCGRLKLKFHVRLRDRGDELALKSLRWDFCSDFR
jgi:hypothetical protein